MTKAQFSASTVGAVASASPRISRRDAVRNRELVIRAALEILTEFGLLGTMDQIADRAGVGRATVYRSFPTRDALREAVANAQLAEVEALAVAVLDDPNPPGLSLVGFVYGLFEYNRMHRLYLELFQGGNLSAGFTRALESTRAVETVLLEAARRDGALRAGVTPEDFFLLTGGISVQLTADLDDSSQRWRRSADLVLHALGVPQALIDEASANL